MGRSAGARWPEYGRVEEGTPCAWRRGGGDGGTAQAEKQPAVARAEVLATVAAKSGGGGGRRPANGPPTTRCWVRHRGCYPMAQALADYGRQEEAAAERAADCEEQVAYLLEADGQDQQAAIHRVSAASCYEKLEQYARAATLLRAALSVQLPADYIARVEQQRTRCLARAFKQLHRTFPRTARNPSPTRH